MCLYLAEPSVACGQEQYLFNNQCYDVCPDNFYPSAINVTFPSQNSSEVTYEAKTCQQCHTSCSLCFGGLVSQCESCVEGYSLMSNSTCQQHKPSSVKTHTYILVFSVIVSGCIIIFVLTFLILVLRERLCLRSYIDKDSGSSDRHLLDSLSESSDNEDEFSQPNGFVTLDLSKSNIGKFSPTHIQNGYHHTPIWSQL